MQYANADMFYNASKLQKSTYLSSSYSKNTILQFLN